MGEPNKRELTKSPKDPLAWSAGLFAAITTFLLAPELLSRLIPETSYRPPLPNVDDSTEVKVDWVPYDSPRIRPRFVEANPEAPKNPPDKTDNFSFRDQQAAQPEAPTIEEEAPNVGGDKPNTQKIVESGDPGATTPPLPILKPDSETAKDFERGTPIGKDDKGRPKKSPAELPESEEDEGVSVKKVKEQGEDDSSKRVIILGEAPPAPIHSSVSPTEPRVTAKPRPRLRLAPDLVRGPLMKTETNAPRLGRIAIECRLHAYGAYVQEMLQAIEDQWHKLGHGSRDFLSRNNLPPLVKLRFKLDQNGRIHDLTKIDAARSSLGSEICRQAIESRAPYGKWTEEMIRDFGGEDMITITFHYK